MSRTYRKLPASALPFRHPHTFQEQKQLRGLEADARVNNYSVSPVNRLHRHLVSSYDDIKVSSFAETFFND